LGSAFYTIITQVQRVRLITQKFKCICAFIHQIDLRDDTDRTFTSWINGFRELERIWVSNVLISSWYRKDKRVWLPNIREYELTNLLLNISGLPMHRYFSNARQIHQRQIDNTRRINRQVNWFVWDTLAVWAGNSVGLLDNFLSNLIKIRHLNSFSV
jgi:hypothetical protein